MLIQVALGQSLQTVIDALPADDQPVTIHLAPGVYEEKIALRRPHTRIEGESAETTRITWHDGAAEILPDGKKRGTFRTATLLVNARDCALRNVTVENSAYPREQVGQALALYVDGDGFHCEDCTLKSCQDTLFTAPLPPREIQKDGFIGPTQFLPRIPQRQVYRHCRIEGDIDFIFGGAAAWFEDCDIEVPSSTLSTKDEVFAHYQDWCKRNGMSPMAMTRFWGRMKSIAPIDESRRRELGRQVRYCNVGLPGLYVSDDSSINGSHPQPGHLALSGVLGL